MKVKAAKKEKLVGQGLLPIKKTKTDIQKAKKLKGALKQSTAKVAAANGASAKLPGKRVFSLKLRPEKAKQQKPAAGKKDGQEKAKQQKPAAGKKDGQEKSPRRKNRSKAAKKQKKQKAAAANQKQTVPEMSEAKKAKKEAAKLINKIKKEERKLGGKLPKKSTEETLALVPEELISKEAFKQIYETFHKKGDEKGNRLFGDDLKYSMQIISVKVPRCPLRICRITYPHSMLRQEDEICLIVKDLTRGRSVDYTPTLHEWEDKLKGLEIGHKVQIIPFQQLKRDYGAYEMKRKLAQRYERFLADARISGHVFAFLGSQFTRRCKTPISVNLENEADIKEVIEKALYMQSYQQGNKGRTTEIKFAAHWMPVEHAVENGMALLEKLKTVYPGGWLNIQTINIATATEKSESLPIHISTVDPNLVPVPVVTGTREKFIKKQQQLLKKRTGGKYEVTKDGVVRMARTPKRYGAANNGKESDVELDDSELEEDNNFLPYDDEPRRQPRKGRAPRGNRHRNVRGPKMRVK
ncbi:ribosomal L1 domain-containing protein CG13096-like [Anopheles funestus]|uniref:ribosomal L1 domain-containing protein CG13096-like n=1 Tax=Anopheles funestus TaxID=62324 RepID=UPI0020C640AD|nr:ribosomal L1 domain-containing protein CG13096-like [Anopheles funestus]